jgi:DNA segregation ATPase FtsK/SpoIIIE, S-DNA-T family
MNRLIKTTQLRQSISDLKSHIQDYTARHGEIRANYEKEKIQQQLILTKSRKTLKKSNEEKLNEFEESFTSQQSIIQKELKQASQSIRSEINLTKTSQKKEYDATVETIRRYSKELILEHRDANAKVIRELETKHETIIAAVNEADDLNQTIFPFLEKSIPLKPTLDLSESEFSVLDNTPSLETQMQLCDMAPFFNRLINSYKQTKNLYQQSLNSPLNSSYAKPLPVALISLVVLYVLGKSQILALTDLNNLRVSLTITTGFILSFLFIHKAMTSSRMKALLDYSSYTQSLLNLCRTISLTQLNNNTKEENEQLMDFCQKEEKKVLDEIQEIDRKKNNEQRLLKEDGRAQLKVIELENADLVKELIDKQSPLLEMIESSCQTELDKITSEFEAAVGAISQREGVELDALAVEWQATWLEKLAQLDKGNAESRIVEKEIFPSWASDDLDNWQPPREFSGAIPFGSLQIDLKKELEFPDDDIIKLKEPMPFSIPALLDFPGKGSLIVNSTKEESRQSAVDLLKNTVLRLLMTLPPGKARFTFIDPIALGETFAGFMHLNDYKEDLTGGRIATNERQIEFQLAELNDHIENTIQKYLRNDFKDICSYNDEVGEIAEAFRFLVINDFPVNFSEEAVKRLISITQSGPRCGVFLIMHHDQRYSVLGDFDSADIEKNCVSVKCLSGDLNWGNCGFKQADFSIEKSPNSSLMNKIIKSVGAASVDASRVELPFSKISSDKTWTESSANDLRAPIGMTGAKQQFIAFGQGTNQHCLIAGKTGSGKSNLLHVIICNMARRYSPQELEFYLVDFKKGVEFKPYAALRLPHARAIAIESDRGFSLSVLRKINEELQARGDKLRDASAQNISQYRKTTGLPMPRTLLIVDEFQELFVEDDMISEEASLLLDRIVRQGRAFGIHIILGSQTLAGAYSLPRTTMGQMTIRIALQCSESDSYVILSENNSAARLLSRPGEAIYNDNAGLIEGNSPCQTVYLPEDEKNDLISSLAQKEEGSAFIFEGNIPAILSSNKEFNQLLEVAPDNRARLLLGEPNAIRPAQSISLENSTGQNVLISGQKEETALAILTSSIISISLHLQECDFVIFDGSATDNPRIEHFQNLQRTIPHSLTIVTPNDAPEAIKKYHFDMITRQSNKVKKPTFIFIHGLQRFRKLKQEESFSWNEEEKCVGTLLTEILHEGPEHKIHTICWADCWGSLTRILSRKNLSEFEHRVLFQMSQSDSVNLIDSPAASKLSLHTALLFNEQTGDTLKFRPFSLPTKECFQKLERESNSLCV